MARIWRHLRLGHLREFEIQNKRKVGRTIEEGLLLEMGCVVGSKTSFKERQRRQMCCIHDILLVFLGKMPMPMRRDLFAVPQIDENRRKTLTTTAETAETAGRLLNEKRVQGQRMTIWKLKACLNERSRT